MSVSVGTRLAPPSFITNNTEWARKISMWAQQAHQGHLDNGGTFTLLSGTTTTVLVDGRISINSFIGFCPTTANAAGATANLYVASQSKGAATLVHVSAATGDRTFKYCLLG